MLVVDGAAIIGLHDFGNGELQKSGGSVRLAIGRGMG